MNPGRIRQLVLLAVLLILPFAVYYFLVYSAEENFFVTLEYVGPSEELSATAPPEERAEKAYRIPTWSFTDQDGQTASSEDFYGRIYVGSFFFTRCPSICPAMNFHVHELQERFKGFDDFRLVSFTVDPAHDSVEALKRYEQKMKADPRVWRFMTGQRDPLYKTANDHLLSAMEDSLAEGGFLHSEQLVLVDWEGRIRSRKDDQGNVVGTYNALDANSLKELQEDIKVLIAEFEKHKSQEDWKREKEAKKQKANAS